jgi:hypothetical protein
MNTNRFLLVPTVFAGLTGGYAQAAINCGSLAAASLPNTVITAAQLVPAGTFQPPTGGAQQNLPEFLPNRGTHPESPDLKNHVRSVDADTGFQPAPGTGRERRIRGIDPVWSDGDETSRGVRNREYR